MITQDLITKASKVEDEETLFTNKIEALAALADEAQACIDSEDIYLKAIRSKKVKYAIEEDGVVNIELKWNIYGVKKGDSFIVPFGKYSYIHSFYKGLARVIRNHKWGLINNEGEEVVEAKYKKIWNFIGRESNTTRAELDGGYYVDVNLVNFEVTQPYCYTKKKLKFDRTSFDDSEYTINNFYDGEGNFDENRYEDALLDGECVEEDW